MPAVVAVEGGTSLARWDTAHRRHRQWRSRRRAASTRGAPGCRQRRGIVDAMPPRPPDRMSTRRCLRAQTARRIRAAASAVGLAGHVGGRCHLHWSPPDGRTRRCAHVRAYRVAAAWRGSRGRRGLAVWDGSRRTRAGRRRRGSFHGGQSHGAGGAVAINAAVVSGQVGVGVGGAAGAHLVEFEGGRGRGDRPIAGGGSAGGGAATARTATEQGWRRVQ